MGTVVIHAGMPKAGSSSVQRWLRQHRDVVRDVLNVELLVYRRVGFRPVGELRRADDGPINSGGFYFRYVMTDRDPAVVDELIDGLRAEAARHDTVLVTSESFAWLFVEADEPFLRALDALASEHTVRVAYYVRAQHESLEAAWRQWGFRSGDSPSAYVLERSASLDYYGTREAIAVLAPNVSFEVRRLTSGVVDDFLSTFLGATQSWDRNTQANVGLPLALVNTLRFAPDGMFWDSIDDNQRLNRLKRLLRSAQIPETAELRNSRQMLHRYCYDRFGEGNAALSAALGWSGGDLVPPPPDTNVAFEGLDALDHLWTCPRKDDDRRALFTALHDGLTDDAAGPAAVAAVERFYAGSTDISS